MSNEEHNGRYREYKTEWARRDRENNPKYVHLCYDGRPRKKRGPYRIARGMNAEEDFAMGVEQIAEALGISHQRVSQVIQRGVRFIWRRKYDELQSGSVGRKRKDERRRPEDRHVSRKQKALDPRASGGTPSLQQGMDEALSDNHAPGA